MLNRTSKKCWTLIFGSFMLTLAGCGGTGAAPINGDSLSPVSITISPQQVSLDATEVQVFTADVSNTSMTTVTWLVNGISGGNSSFGTIDKHGNYTAPPYVPVPPNVTVTAVSNADETKSANAAVSLSGPAVPGSVIIMPKSASVYVLTEATFTATVNAPNPDVIWEVNGVEGGDSSVGTITAIPGSSQQGLYIAPAQVPDSGQVTVAAVSVANPQQAASAIVTVLPPIKGGAVVTITNPLIPPTVQAGQTQAFQASVTGVSDTTVSWLVDGISGGNASVGTIATGTNDSATYTAPEMLPNPPQVSVTAVSNAQPSAQASLLVFLIADQKVTVTVSPDPCTNPAGVVINSNVQFTATVNGTNNQSVTWQVNQITGGNSQVGTISSSGEYMAPASVPNPATVTITAVSNAVPSVSGSLNITLVASPALAISLVPLDPGSQYPDIYTDAGQEFEATVQGATDPSQVQVNWLINSYSDGDGGIYGSIVPDQPVGCVTDASYEAPDTVPSPSQFPITAQSAYNPNDSASVTITIINQPQVQVTVDPTNADVPQTTQQLFNVTINGNPNPNAYWALSSQQCSGVACGTLSTTGPSTSTTYTAPVQGTPTVTLTATSQGDSSAQGTAAITVTCGGPPSIAIFPSSATVAAGAVSPLSFSAEISPCGNQTVQVNWQLGCISLWDGDPSENCFDSDFDGDGPGCTQINNGTKVCGDRANVGPGDDPLSYFAPKNLFTNAFAPNVCEPVNNGSGDGLVPLTATVQLNGCPQQGCQATACITVTPP